MYNMDNEEIKYHEIISKNIKKLRTSAKYSQEEMAEKLSCSREFISRVENRKEKISLNMLLKIANLFNVNPSSLFKLS
ncbi:TPA: XRE family transcriptional regulator [Candidatus Gastranaerophilales bacterium HUM_20]|jgi:putative lexA repressor|nr:helix-turn-helix domain protein [Clostridium sp. CAG:729]DAB20671.1 MAG TPA: XRE family transcriptional regulator [Candidatus Gastranaerophilales bacterium HUM_20]